MLRLSHGGHIRPPFFDEGGHVGGEGRFQEDALAGAGVGEAEGAGMEGLAGADGEAVLDELAVFGVDGALADLAAAIAFVVEEGMADGGHMDADLVGPAGFQAAFHDGDEAVALEHFPMGDGPFPLVGIVVHAEAEAVVGVAADGAGDGALVLGDVAPDDGGIDAVDGMDEELVGEVRLRLRVLGDDQQAAGVLVDAVHEHAETLVLAVRPLGDPQVEGERVHERPGVVPVPRMDYHPGGLVDNEDVVVLVGDVQRDVLRQDFHAAPLVRHHELDDVAGADDGIGLGGLVVDEDVAELDGLLDAVAGGVFLVGGDELVHTQGRLAFVGHQAEMFEHFLLVLLREKGLFVKEGHYSAGIFSGSSVRYRLMDDP